MDASTTTFDRLALQIYSPRHEVYVNTKSTRLQDVERLGASLHHEYLPVRTHGHMRTHAPGPANRQFRARALCTIP